MAHHLSQLFPKPGRNVFTQLCTFLTLADNNSIFNPHKEYEIFHPYSAHCLPLVFSHSGSEIRSGANVMSMFVRCSFVRWRRVQIPKFDHFSHFPSSSNPPLPLRIIIIIVAAAVLPFFVDCCIGGGIPERAMPVARFPARSIVGYSDNTVLVLRKAQRKWKDTKQHPGTAGPGNMLGCCLISFHFLWVIHPIRPVKSGRDGDKGHSKLTE